MNSDRLKVIEPKVILAMIGLVSLAIIFFKLSLFDFVNFYSTSTEVSLFRNNVCEEDKSFLTQITENNRTCMKPSKDFCQKRKCMPISRDNSWRVYSHVSLLDRFVALQKF